MSVPAHDTAKKPQDLGAEHDQAQAKANDKAAPAQEHANANPAQKYKFQILVDSDLHIQSLKLGHAWVRLITPDSQVSSWGFWPAHNLNLFSAFTSVKGQVRSPDNAHT